MTQSINQSSEVITGVPYWPLTWCIASTTCDVLLLADSLVPKRRWMSSIVFLQLMNLAKLSFTCRMTNTASDHGSEMVSGDLLNCRTTC
jgi:hypothetical protein